MLAEFVLDAFGVLFPLFIAAEITGLLSDDGSGLTWPFRLTYSADTSLISYDDMSTWQWCKNLMLTTLLMEIPACFPRSTTMITITNL